MKKWTGIFFILLIFASCGDDSNGFVLMSLDEEIKLGKQVKDEIAANPTEYPVLSPTDYASSYAYLESLKNQILSSDKIKYKDKFEWELHIIHRDDVLNAFATPGGYIYVYTGLIKYLETADDLAGVLGHEIAHADRRHSAKQLQKNYGISIILGVLAGNNPNELTKIAAQVAGSIAGLSFSRNDEAEADEYSVEYLADTEYKCNGAASFFEKLLKDNQTSGVPEFLSTHPSPENRVEDINNKAKEINCDITPSGDTGYATFKASLP